MQNWGLSRVLKFLVIKPLLNQTLPCLSGSQHVVEGEGLWATLEIYCAYEALHVALKTQYEQK